MGFTVVHSASPLLQHAASYIGGYTNANRQAEAIENQANAQVASNTATAIGQGVANLAQLYPQYQGLQAINQAAVMNDPASPQAQRLQVLGAYGLAGPQAAAQQAATNYNREAGFQNQMAVIDDQQAFQQAQQQAAHTNRIDYLRNATAYQAGGDPAYIESLGVAAGAPAGTPQAYGIGLQQARQQAAKDQWDQRIRYGQAMQMAQRGVFEGTTAEFSPAQRQQLAKYQGAQASIMGDVSGIFRDVVTGNYTGAGIKALGTINRAIQGIRPQGKFQTPQPTLAQTIGPEWQGNSQTFASRTLPNGDMLIAYPGSRGNIEYEKIVGGANGPERFQMETIQTPAGPALVTKDRNGVPTVLLKPRDYADAPVGQSRARTAATRGRSGGAPYNPETGMTASEIAKVLTADVQPVYNEDGGVAFNPETGEALTRPIDRDDVLAKVARLTRNDGWGPPETNSTMVDYANRLVGDNGPLRSLLFTAENAFRGDENPLLQQPVQQMTGKQVANAIIEIGGQDLPRRPGFNPPTLRQQAEAAWTLMNAYGVPYENLPDHAQHALGTYENHILAQPEIAQSLGRLPGHRPGFTPEPRMVEFRDPNTGAIERRWGVMDGGEFFPHVRQPGLVVKKMLDGVPTQMRLRPDGNYEVVDE